MAIYHLHVKIIQRSKGRNVVSAAAYRHAARLYDYKEARYWDYTKKDDVIYTEILVPEHAPSWVKELGTMQQTDVHHAAELLWNKVEAAEKRVDSQLAREIEFALPLELDQEQSIGLAREFIQDQFVLRDMIADWSIHWDQGNPHVHVLLTMRELSQDGFGKRVLAWNNKALLTEWRKQWAEYANFHLRLHQHEAKIDHRSYAEQGIDLVPTIHQGQAVTDMDRRGIPTEIMREAQVIMQENLARISVKPSIVFDKLSRHGTTFTHKELGQELGRYVNDQGKFSAQERGVLAEATLRNLEDIEYEIEDHKVLTAEHIAQILKSIEHYESVFTEQALVKLISPFTQNAKQFAQAILQIKASPELLFLGPGEDGRDRFTTRALFDLENQMQHIAERMRTRGHHNVSPKTIRQILGQYHDHTGKHLTDEQLAAVQHILKPAAISCLIGRAGTGKSFTLGAAKAVWEAQGLQVQGVTLSGIAAVNLSQEAGIESRTIESFRYAIEKGILTLNSQDVIVMDEAGMTDSVAMMAVLRAAHTACAKLVLVGDDAQLQPVGPGASFRALLERVGFAEIHTVYRQREAWQRRATLDLSRGRIKEGLEAYLKHNCIHFAKTKKNTLSQLVQNWLAISSHTKDLSQCLVIAHRNVDVRALNYALRSARVQRGDIIEGFAVESASGTLRLAVQDRILFLKNDRSLGVANGRFATITSIQCTEAGRIIDFKVVLDGTQREITINPQHYRDFTYGYAATVHKTQGITVDHALVYAGGTAWNRHLTYVALSRHRQSCHLYADTSTHQNFQTLQQRLGRYGMKDSVLDFPLAFAARRGISDKSLLRRLPQYLSQHITRWKEKIAAYFYPEPIAAKATIEETLQRRDDARLVAHYVDLCRDVGIAWQSLQQQFTAMELENITSEKQIFAQIAAIPEYATIQSALRARNHAAHHIMCSPEYYTKAIAIYMLNEHKLAKHAEQHHCYERVCHYIHASQQGSVVPRDRLAAKIMHNSKAHYPYIQSFQLNRQELQQHATQHQHRREKLSLKSPKETQDTSLESLLTRYIDMELEQTKLVQAMHRARLEDPKAVPALTAQALAHSNGIEAFAADIVKYPAIQAELETLKTMKPASLAQRGGFSAIRERIKQGSWLKEDIYTVITQLRYKAHAQRCSQSQDRDRGGRSQL